jgi:hypothetical protein
VLEDRIKRLERAVGGYLDYRGKLAIKNATLEEQDEPLGDEYDVDTIRVDEE